MTEIERAIEKFTRAASAVRLAARAAGQDAGAAGLALMSWAALAPRRRRQGAHALIAAALSARRRSNIRTRRRTFVTTRSVLHALQGELAIALQNAERCVGLSEEHGFGQWRNLSRVIRGYQHDDARPVIGPALARRREKGV